MNNLELLEKMKHSEVSNYVIPGLSSHLIGGLGKGTVRLFECSRDHQEEISPHSHRFDFTCLVLVGDVIQRLWKKDQDGDEFQATELVKSTAAQFGKYIKTPGPKAKYRHFDTHYSSGQWYSMKKEEIHSIHFSRGCKVLFFEGPPEQDFSIILEPVVKGKVVPTFRVDDWMFERIKG